MNPATGQGPLTLLHRHRTGARPFARLVCLPHAGAAPGMFSPWAEDLGPGVELVSVRYGTPDDAPDTMSVLAQRITAQLALLPRRPTTLFGHSMGGIVAYEVARRCSVRVGLTRLVVSGTVPPALHRPGDTHRLDDDAFITALVRLGGTDPRLFTDAASRDVWLPRVRQDYRLIDTYQYRPTPPLACPVTAMTGRADQEAPVDLVRSWRYTTTAAFDLTVHPGGHFHLLDDRREVVAELRRRLGRQGATPSSLSMP
ncbi:thioesterase II family protein [Streptomyces sp. 5-10]|uniref:thioesterase II family protein n=1 Tax=Streptomyces sp. 5-10 TaxID=878925 RepID=UPI001CC29BB1|nr:alpha/beta fold hydrolase [Streptomyces sp. 5-10]